MIKQHKDILAAVIRDLRHELLGYTAKDGAAVRGDLDRELERLGVLPDGRVQPIDTLPGASAQERQVHYAAEQFIDAARRQGRAADKARSEFVEQAGYSWINRLVALRALEARRLIDGTLRPGVDYGGASEALYLLAQTNPARAAAPDGGWWEVIEQACARQAEALPGLFGRADPVLTLRPSVPALRRCVDRIGRGPAGAKAQEIDRATVEETDKAFADPDAIGWAYQFYQEEAKAAAFASFKAGKKADSRAAIAAATQLFTEPYMVKWLLHNSLGRSYHEIYPQSALPASWEYYIRPSDDRPLGSPASTAASLEMLTVMDPCVGSGHFLREAFDLLAAMYREQHSDWNAQRVVETILRHHLHGIDIDPRAVQLAALTLYMRALELLRDEARARRKPMPRWAPPQINLATTPSGLDAAALERHLARHPEDRPLRPVLERIFETLSQAEILGSLLRPGAEIDAAIAKVQAPRQSNMFDASSADASLMAHDPSELKRLVLERIAVAFRAEADSADPADALFGREAERGVRLLQLLDRKYAVVVTNPPYMGSGNMSGILRNYVEKHYYAGRNDLYTAFILRCLDLCLAVGRAAIVTINKWMFLSSFTELRLGDKKYGGLLDETTIEVIADLGSRAFALDNHLHDGVQVGLYNFMNTRRPTDHKLIAYRFTGPRSPEEKDLLARSRSSNLRSSVEQEKFESIVNAPLVYFLDEEFLSIYDNGTKLSEIAQVKQGLATADDNRFLRYTWEIGNLSNRWVAFTKGGGYCKWFGQNWYTTDWQFNGARLNVFERSVVRNPAYYFQDGWSYSLVSAGSLALRRFDTPGCIGHKGPGVYSNHFQLPAIAQSHIMAYMLRAVSPQLAFEISTITSAPLISNLADFPTQLSEVATFLKRLYVASSTIDRSFAGIPPTAQSNMLACLLHTLEAVTEYQVNSWYGLTADAIKSVLIETGTPAGFHPLIASYDALPELPTELELPELPPEVIEYLDKHERLSPSPTELARIKARLRALYEAGPGAKDDGAGEDEDAAGGEDDEGEGAVAGAHIPIPTETFLEELSVKMELHPISVYWLLEELRSEGARCKPEERRLVEDRLSVLALRLLGHRWPRQIEAGEPLPRWADPDGIIPLVNLGTGETTLGERLRERLREEDGDTGSQRTEALLAELTDATSLEDWLARIFWPRHVKQFKSRPIAWQLASRPVGAGKGRGTRRAPLFECMLYYHASEGDALARLRTQYVEPLLRREESALNEALSKENTEAAASANLRVQELREFLGRLQQVEREGFACAELDALLAKEPLDRWSGDGIVPPAGRADLLRQERAWHVDLNDGVRVNIAPIQLAGLLPGEVLRVADARKAIADRARWRSDERRWVREGKLPRCGWMPESVPESPEWTRRAPERAAEQARLEEKRRTVQVHAESESNT